MRKQHGFTLIELMIVVAIIAIIAAIAIPNLLSARLNANETSAIATLRNISTSQAQFQATAKADVDDDGTGEFGMFRELSGAVAVRTDADGTNTGGATLNPSVLSGAFRKLNANNQVGRSGYLFAMRLPDVSGGSQGEDGSTATQVHAGGADLDVDMSETTWACYAWPATYANSGNRTFFVNQAGDIVSKDDLATSGSGSAPNGGDAFQPGGGAQSISGFVSVGTLGRDGKKWKQVN